MNLIVNICENWGIGFAGSLLVSIPSDLRRFRQLTTGKTVILGRRTLSTFPGGRPLKNRTNLILSAGEIPVEDALVFPNLDKLFQHLKNLDLSQVSVIGGASVYRALLPYCDRAYVTKTYVSPPADVFFPNLDEMDLWTATETGPILEENGLQYQYIDYINTMPLALPE